MELFTDREQGIKQATVETIGITVWNGIVSIFNTCIGNESFSYNFPLLCPDNNSICGCDTTALNDSIKGAIPKIQTPIKRIETQKKSCYLLDDENEESSLPIDTFSILDFIEFCYNNLHDVGKKNFHQYFNHYHLEFKDTKNAKSKFREDINNLFARNQIAFKLNENGQIVRLITPELSQLVSKSYTTNDRKLNELLKEATESFVNPHEGNKQRAIEKLWDSFERIKTYLNVDKRTSINQIIQLASNGSAELSTYLNNEANELTKIGNEFQIRHFEQGKHEIKDSHHYDYLFHRLLSLISLIITKLP